MSNLLCPIQTIFNQKEEVQEFTYCHQHGCAWWNTGAGSCAILVLSWEIGHEVLLTERGMERVKP